MTNTDAPEIRDDTKVRLKDEVADIYPWAAGGAKGWVRKHRTDEYDAFQLVWVAWDPNDWRVNGQPDGWYFEKNFESIEDDMALDDDTRKQLAAVAESLAKIASGDDPEPGPEATEASEDDTKAYMAALEQAVEAARGGEAFVLFSVLSEPHPENPQIKIYNPIGFSGHLSEEARIMLSSQVSIAGARAHYEAAVGYAEAIAKKSETS